MLIALAVLLSISVSRRQAAVGVHLSLLWKCVPVAGVLTSLTLFTLSTGSDFAARGAIYDAVRQELRGMALIVGSRSDTMTRIYSNSELNFFVTHEHGQAPHLLTQSGVIGLAILLGLLFAMVRLDLRNAGSRFALARTIVMATMAP